MYTEARNNLGGEVRVLRSHPFTFSHRPSYAQRGPHSWPTHNVFPKGWDGDPQFEERESGHGVRGDPGTAMWFRVSVHETPCSPFEVTEWDS